MLLATRCMFEKIMPEKFAYYSSQGIRVAGVLPGSYVRLHQGHRRADNTILHESDTGRKSGDEFFSVFVVFVWNIQ